MAWTTALAIYFIIWWVVLFAICWVVYVYRLVSLDDLATLWGLLK